jgi:glycosyltransferase involved in cell wall biosynthesis
LQLSGARGVIYLLGPPGLFGWSFSAAGWEELPDPRTVALDSVGRPETYRIIDGLGFAIWTNAVGMAAAGKRAGVTVEWLGTGTPVPFPAMPTKTSDVAMIEANRWADHANELLIQLPEVSVHRIGPTPSTYSLCDAMSPAHILVWPSRIEGMSRISREARAVGTVPVALATNPFATREDHGDGVVLVSSPPDIVDEIRRLLKDKSRLKELQNAAATGARMQVDWGGFVDRVGTVVTDSVENPTRPARQRLGDELRSRVVAKERAAEGRLFELEAELLRIEAERDRASSERDRARAELEAYRRRLMTRLVDGSPVGAKWRALRSRFMSR